MSAEIVNFANARIQRAAAVTAARAASDAAELAAMHAVGKLVDAIARDKARGELSAPEVYLARFNQEKRP